MQKVCNNTKNIHYNVKKYFITSKNDIKSTLLRRKVHQNVKIKKHAMRSKNLESTSSWRQKICHDITNKSRVFMKSKIRDDIKKFVMKSKRSLWRQKHVITSNSSSCLKKVKKFAFKNISRRQQVRHDVKKFVMTSKTCHDEKGS